MRGVRLVQRRVNCGVWIVLIVGSLGQSGHLGRVLEFKGRTGQALRVQAKRDELELVRVILIQVRLVNEVAVLTGANRLGGFPFVVVNVGSLGVACRDLAEVDLKVLYFDRGLFRVCPWDRDAVACLVYFYFRGTQWQLWKSKISYSKFMVY